MKILIKNIAALIRLLRVGNDVFVYPYANSWYYESIRLRFQWKIDEVPFFSTSMIISYASAFFGH